MNPPDVPVSELQSFGYLQEVNRQFFHPLGLALYVKVADDGSMTVGGVADFRDDMEGVVFIEDSDEETAKRQDAAWRVQAEWEARAAVREKALGFVVQPVGGEAIGSPPPDLCPGPPYCSCGRKAGRPHSGPVSG